MLYIEDAIPNMRIVRDDALSICHLADPPDEAAANASLADACEDALRYFDVLYCCQGPLTILPHDRHGLTGEAGAMFAAYQRHDPQAEACAAIPHEAIDNLCERFGVFSLTQQDLLRDPAYLGVNELSLIEPDRPEDLDNLCPEFAALGTKKAVQMRMKEVLPGDTGKSRDEVIRELCPMIRQMPLGASTTNWQLRELNAINVLMHGTSFRPEIEELLSVPLGGTIDLSRPSLSRETAQGPSLMQAHGQDILDLAGRLTREIDHHLADRAGGKETPRIHLVIYAPDMILDAMMRESRSLRAFFKAHREDGKCFDTPRCDGEGHPIICCSITTVPDEKTRLAIRELAVSFPDTPIFLDNQRLKPSGNIRPWKKKQSAAR